ncbi:M1 family metallopeptidase [Flavobacterium gawalongense]|uniref:M1 family metallopeptidase n=1 Tax=Flavobacterium gawalongense TaxID=2594432 RepID=UPI0011843B80|nr:M1 family metallopeptidase [Flavobacterium gawalongense]TRX05927.1 M1 family metallopeptidase [Flavobacterium gawalongense]TRX21762.1 M1 family metallopeptidase [Flavobacterium gawalongense]
MKYLFLLLSTITFAQQTQSVDFKLVHGQITINPKDKSVRGAVSYWFDVLKPTDTIKIDAQNMDFTDAELNQKEIQFTTNGKQILLISAFKKGTNNISFNYVAKPKQTLYFVGSEEKDNVQIWTQGQGKNTSNWFPSFDDVKEKVIFNLEVVVDSKYQVISNGILKSKVNNNSMTYWRFNMHKPMSSYLLMLSIGKFEKQTQKSNSGIPLEMYYESKDAAKFEPTYRYSKQLFDFLEKAIGVKYPWEIYKQAPVRDFLYAGMENTSATLFSTRYVVDFTGYEDRSYTNVNAHELAHQWFGNLVTAETSKHHWLQEGFATYYALLAEKEIYGEDYFYSKLYESAQQLKYASRTDTIPVLNAKASSLTFYQKGAWALHVLHETIGDKAFKKAVKCYLKKHSFQTVNTQDFFAKIKKVSDYDLNNFSKVWLETTSFNTQEANTLLYKNKAIRILFEVEKLRNKPLSEKEEFFTKIVQSNVYFSVKEAIVNQLKEQKFEDKATLLSLALDTKNVQVRQAVATTLNEIPESFRVQYETLLDDKSYQTQEIALYNLWNNFPEQRSRYLDKSKGWIGFSDYNLRTLWLSLALSTANYSINKEQLIEELINYSSSNYEATIRQDALEKLLAFNIINDEVLENLVKATTHHMWQFSKFGRDNIRRLLKNATMRASFERILSNLNVTEQFQLNRLLKE